MSAYKVCHVSGGISHSWSRCLDQAGCVVYQIGVTSCRPKNCGPLGVLATLEAARAYVKRFGYAYPSLIYECEVEVSSDDHFWTTDVKHRYWACWTVYDDQLYADSVTPLRVIEEKEDGDH